MSWNNKEEIETTCTVQQWRLLPLSFPLLHYSHHIYLLCDGTATWIFNWFLWL